jgi:response regulator RpfG family c-di-GMP phosphodiesterase
MRSNHDIHVLLTGPDTGECDGLTEAMRSEGWLVAIIEDMQDCAAKASSGACHMVVVVCQDPRQLQRQPVRALMGLRADMSVMLLVRDNWDEAAPSALAGVTSDQVHNMSRPVPELMEVFKEELRCVLLDRTQYTIMYVDDDREFLTSIEAFLPDRLRAALPRFDLAFEFFDEPLEALAACKQIGNRLAVVVSDQVMPNINGIELLTRIKDMHPYARRVLLTGHAGLDSAVTAINKRVLHKYVFKPVDPVDFSESIRLLLSEYHLGLRVETRQDRIMSQFEFIRAVTAATKPSQVLHNTLAFLCEQMGPTHVRVALMQDGQLFLKAANPQPLGASANKPLSMDEGIWGWLAQHRRPICAARDKDLPDAVNLALPLPMMAAPVVRDNVFLGAILLSGRQHGGAFSREENMLLNFVADVSSVAFGSFSDRAAVEKSYVSTMASLMETVEAKDSYTRGHTERVMVLAMELARAAGITDQSLQQLEWAAALHDIGKIALPDAILLKAAPLSAHEYAVMKAHTTRADRILQHLKYLGAARIIIRSHHERYDGKGYPDGLAREEIPIGARILAIADSYDAMTSARPYRGAMDPRNALAEIEKNAETQFDPQLAATFLKYMRSRVDSLSAAETQKTSVSLKEP